jgi:hypothetical protein
MLDGVVIDDTELFNGQAPRVGRLLQLPRPHGGLDGQTPYERLRQKSTTPPA